jgi:hypothetical protein
MRECPWNFEQEFIGSIRNWSIFQGMQSTTPPVSSSPSSFAGFLAALSQPGRSTPSDTPSGAPTRAPRWSDESLAEDVATLSYEQALRAHARYHADEPVADPVEAARLIADQVAAPEPQAVAGAEPLPERVLKQSSITIRLSREEDAQLRRRAAEAGLTVSAYIRSCTFEAEALRALVKDTLTQLRTGGAPPQLELPIRRRRWSALFWPGRRAAHNNGNQA